MSDRRLALSVVLQGVGNLSTFLKTVTGASGQSSTALRKLTDTARLQRNELKDLRSEMGAAGVATRDMFEREKQLSDQIAATTRKIDAQKASMGRITKARATGDQARSKGSGNLMAAGAIAAPLFLDLKAASDFGEGMIDIQQKANLSADAAGRLQKNILAAAHDAHQLPENLRAGVDTLAGFGMTPQQSAAMIAPIGKAATAYRAELDALSAASFAVYDNLKVPLNQTSLALDAMARSGKDGAFELKDMAMYFPALTAAAQGLGQSGIGAVADLSAALQIARKGAGNSASAANNVQNLLAKINTKDTIKNFKDFGVDLPAAMKKAYAEGKTPLEAIAELTTKATGGDMSKLAFLFSDMQVQQALRPLIANMDEYRKIRANAMQAVGTVDADFAVRSQSAGTNARALMGDLQRLAITAGSQLLPPLVKITGQVLAVTDKVAAWTEKNPKLTAMIMQGVVALLAFNLALGAGRIAFGSVVGPITQAIEAYRWLKEIGVIARIVSVAGPLLAGNFAVIGTAATAFGGAMATAGAFLMANPIILAIVALVAVLAFAVPWIIKNWDALKAGFGAAAAYLMTALQPIIAPIMAVISFLGSIWDKIKAPLAAGLKMALDIFLQFTPLGAIISGIMPVINWLKTIDWAAMGRDIIQGLINGIVFMLGPLGKVLKGAAEAGINAFKQKAEIHSPSRVFMGFGENITEGLNIGIARSVKRPLNQARNLAAGVAGAMAITAGTPSLAASASGITASQLPAARHASGAAAVHMGGITINIYAQPGQSVTELQTAVENAVQNVLDKANATSRASYGDDDA
ncbi:hypothetical protein MMA231_02499 [Asticcacaulis sp. MM231]|uniref:phage tail tape measure protein n=1 Tax=Asticcacaulis sp. MM231 TaxID=3157666 RepID=UPI0032D568C5